MTISQRDKQLAKQRLNLANPWHLLATGFGSGLSPVVPGTMGSLASIPFWCLLIMLPWPMYWLVVLVAAGIGIYLCHVTARDMGVHDHGSIVWDEFVGMWITLAALPLYNWQWVLAGFVVFRVLDMWKPWPVRWFDRNVHGGLGIMVDDIVAGIISAGIIFLAGHYYG
ncbi:phosphatidylglycerophosphatase A [Shimwellia blattae]|uniref:Phosphatidylglycerophosphatase A n=1 Tax=Shimwellia blattae (strain ATCC 29907 / DSM 4481 / JCM 1650 / NBRC 105725 / CDC 9005-74) TaxID=630626 RepID=I2BBS0_SHIBC|nr:phosphatidylglycerophosphatase A [Shimwellia blattae]AFJ47974.1 phosphatidylglycerophosphatase A [Shimwellia blattae DSM 4481 = NBRC 105725]GAB82812.1 phosphatidylglycerophosphatase A [Shimwellia blattae DSM 4481 = NBRC 105725]VDY65473.1 Phosphatidylglycerophosphatase A [Shimwellia blattae]VEC24702.1 Phosphatidylglycerophosphatase A [Shimwellia blattae]